ncbi:MAG: hypothetical protein ACOX6T_22275 [Myxococcales bacterium]|jgi:hypothetical protein
MPPFNADDASPIFLGYRAKKPWVPEGDWDPDHLTGVVEVCSVSDCLARPPPDWIERWDFNRACCYATVEAAWETVPDDDRADYRVFALWLVSATTDESGEWVYPRPDDWFPADQPELPRGVGPTDLPRLGFGVVSLHRKIMGWGHSPLSCNLMAREGPVNRYCLIDTLEEAAGLIERWNHGGEGVEPETYCAVLVYATEP